MSARPGLYGGQPVMVVPTVIASNQPDRRIRDGTKLRFLSYPQSRIAMRTLKVSLIASLIGTAVGLGSWIFGIGQIIWPAHPQFACFLLTLVATIVIQITWPRLTETNSQ